MENKKPNRKETVLKFYMFCQDICQALSIVQGCSRRFFCCCLGNFQLSPALKSLPNYCIQYTVYIYNRVGQRLNDKKNNQSQI